MHNITKKLVFSIVILFFLNGISSVYANNKTIDIINTVSEKLVNNNINQYEKPVYYPLKEYSNDNIPDRYKYYHSDINTSIFSSLIYKVGWDIVVPDDYPSIKIALDHSQEGFKIFVRKGIYYENIIIKLNGIVLQGESSQTTIIDGSNKSDVILINGNNVSISGFTVQLSGMNGLGKYYAGIKLSGINSCIISNCKIQNNKGYGIVIEDSINCTLFENIISINQYDGVYLIDAYQIQIAETFFENNTENEINCYNSSYIYIFNNSILSKNMNAALFTLSHNCILIGNNITGLGFTCIQFRCSSYNLVKQNTIYSQSDSALSFLYKSNRNNISYNTFIDLSSKKDSIGIFNQDSDSNKIYENIISKYDRGICSLESGQLELELNKILFNNIGISLNACNEICILKNNVSYNKKTALIINQSNFIIIKNNIIDYNILDGIKMVLFSDNSQIVDNYIVNNRENGINLNCCQNITVSNNFISYNKLNGLYINECTISNISNNIFISNTKFGLYIIHFDFRNGNHKIVDNKFYECGVFNERSFNNIFQNNTINDKPLLYLEGYKNHIIANESFGSIILVKCENITIQNQHIHNTSVGIELLFSTNCKITQNIFECNRLGVYLMYSNTSSITKNNFIKNEIDATFDLWINDPIRTNIWDSNYWDSAYIIVFPIHGLKYVYILNIWLQDINSVCFDFHPLKIPYEFNTQGWIK